MNENIFGKLLSFSSAGCLTWSALPRGGTLGRRIFTTRWRSINRRGWDWRWRSKKNLYNWKLGIDYGCLCLGSGAVVRGWAAASLTWSGSSSGSTGGNWSYAGQCCSSQCASWGSTKYQGKTNNQLLPLSPASLRFTSSAGSWTASPTKNLPSMDLSMACPTHYSTPWSWPPPRGSCTTAWSSDWRWERRYLTSFTKRYPNALLFPKEY